MSSEQVTYTEDTTPCVIRGHKHSLTFVRRDFQEVTGNEAWTLQCPTNSRVRFLRIVNLHGVTMPIERMPRMAMPRHGWKVTAERGYAQ